MKIIIGSKDTKQEGWISTDIDTLNLLDETSFKTFFKGEKADAMLAEHVWEHLSLKEGKLAAKNCYEYLKEGSYIRVAVPDGNLRDVAFQNMIQVGGPGPKEHPAYSHKIVYDYKMLVSVFEKAGFIVNLLEYCDETGKFYYKYWNSEDGKVGRSFRYDTRNSISKIGIASIIIDAYKPLIVEGKS